MVNDAAMMSLAIYEMGIQDLLVEAASGIMFRGAGAIPADEITAALNKLGNEGWEAVSVFPIAMAEGATNIVGILLKRAVPG
jgi:hypothetical protein